MYDVIIIGAGASGLAAAIESAKNGAKTLVLERNNSPAHKIFATGNGHCNYMNLKSEGAEKLKADLESIGIIGVLEEDGRLYPRSKEAAAVEQSLEAAATKYGAEILCDTHVADVQKNVQGFKVVSKDGRKFESKRLIIAVGGKAGIQFGCYGEGYRWAQYMGHHLVKPVPALVAVECQDDISALHGVRVNAKTQLLCNGQVIGSDQGEVQFTKDAISGICVMNLAGKLRLAEGLQYELSIDMFPEYTEGQLVTLFMQQIKASGCAMNGLVPSKMHDYLHTKISLEEHNPETMAKLTKDLRFTLKGTKGWADAQVTAGGVPMEEVDEHFQSKLIPGLFFTGEILDYDGPCGGYNLAFAFRSGFEAGKTAASGVDGAGK